MALPSNYIARPYRGVSVQRWHGRLDPDAVNRLLFGREAYRRTEFIVLKANHQVALVRVAKESQEPLFSPITRIEWLAGPDDALYIKEPSVDTSNATSLAQAALARGSGWRAYIVEGMFEHVNFIFDPRPISVRVAEVVPPKPPKLLVMAQQAIAFDEDLPPVEMTLDAIDIVQLARDNPDRRYLLPCRGSGVDLPAPVDFLDERPPQADWTLIGCERSRQLYEWFYGHQPRRVEICPRKLPMTGSLTLAKCCLLERGLEFEENRVIVPWGATLKEVQTALRVLCGVEPPTTDEVGPSQAPAAHFSHSE